MEEEAMMVTEVEEEAMVVEHTIPREVKEVEQEVTEVEQEVTEVEEEVTEVEVMVVMEEEARDIIGTKE